MTSSLESNAKSPSFNQSAPDSIIKDRVLLDAAHMIVEAGIGSRSMLQRRMKISYNRASRIMNQLCQVGVVGESRGYKPREVHVRDIPELECMLDRFYGGK